jgi:dTDP-4-dehydrorhamnose reductase
MKNKTAKPIAVLVVGATGLIGSTIFRHLSKNKNFAVSGTIRDPLQKNYFSSIQAANLDSLLQAADHQKWQEVFQAKKPEIVINCLGMTKHIKGGNDPLVAIPINSYFPHYLNALCQDRGSRLVHISSDCVFSGNQGGYLESDPPDAQDFYGRSKALGEVTQGSAITLRTSTIGHELQSSFGLLDWFLSQKGSCQGFKKAYFSGVSTIELAKIIERFVIPNANLQGLYHVGATKISKFDLLTLIAQEYGKKIEIIPDISFKIDRSLNSDRFYRATGYKSSSWKQLIKEMHLSK